MEEEDVSQKREEEDKSETEKELEKKKAELEKESKKSLSPLDEAKEVNKKKEELLEREEKLLDRKEKLAAEELVGGRAEAGQPAEKPKELTDTEYAEALERGEVNPLKEDGFIK